MRLYVANAPLTVDENGGRRVVSVGELLDPALVASWDWRGVAALVETDKVVVYDTDEYAAVLAEYGARFGDGAAKKPARKKTAVAA